MRRRRGSAHADGPAGVLFCRAVFVSETEARAQSDVAAAERRIILKDAGAAARVDVEQVIGLKRQRQLGICSERVIVERRVDEREAGRVGLMGAVRLCAKSCSTSIRPSTWPCEPVSAPITRSGGISGAGPNPLIVARTASVTSSPPQLIPKALPNLASLCSSKP